MSERTDMRTTVSRSGETIDAITWREYGAGGAAIDAVLSANPELNRKGPVLEPGTLVYLPELVVTDEPVRRELW